MANPASRPFSEEQSQACYVNCFLHCMLIYTLEPKMKSITTDHKIQNTIIRSFYNKVRLCTHVIYYRKRVGLNIVSDLLKLSYAVNSSMQTLS